MPAQRHIHHIGAGIDGIEQSVHDGVGAHQTLRIPDLDRNQGTTRRNSGNPGTIVHIPHGSRCDMRAVNILINRNVGGMGDGIVCLDHLAPQLRMGEVETVIDDGYHHILVSIGLIPGIVDIDHVEIPLLFSHGETRIGRDCLTFEDNVRESGQSQVGELGREQFHQPVPLFRGYFQHQARQGFIRVSQIIYLLIRILLPEYLHKPLHGRIIFKQKDDPVINLFPQTVVTFADIARTEFRRNLSHSIVTGVFLQQQQ